MLIEHNMYSRLNLSNIKLFNIKDDKLRFMKQILLKKILNDSMKIRIHAYFMLYFDIIYHIIFTI